jgi:hypothetical protein
MRATMLTPILLLFSKPDMQGTANSLCENKQAKALNHAKPEAN